MAVICPNCGSADTQALVDKNQCLNCGALLAQDGTVAASGADQNTKDMIAKSLAPREVNLVGNFADLQRAGAVGQFDQSNAKADVGSQTEANEATNQSLADAAQAQADASTDTTSTSTPDATASPSGDQVTTTQSWGSAGQ